MKGTIIVIEGTDGSGKKTQTQLLFENLKSQGYSVIMHSLPSYESQSSGGVKMYLEGKLGQTADSVSPKQASILFAADRVASYLNVETGLKAHYENGGIIIFDRYVHSNMVHQACKIKETEEVEEFLNWINKLEFEDLKLPKADLVFFLDMPPKISKNLANKRSVLKAGTSVDIHESDEEYLKRAYKTAKNVANKYDWMSINCTDKLGNIRTINEISEEILIISEKFLNKKQA